MIKPKVEIKEKKNVQVDFKKMYRELANSYVTVGIHKDAGQYEDGTDVVTVALANEFGVPSKKIPQRSYFRTTIEENSALIDKWRDEAIENIFLHGWTVVKALKMIGLRVQILVQNKIKSNVPPPNALSTQLAKAREGVVPSKIKGGGQVGKNVQLINSGTLMNSKLLLRSVGFHVYVKGNLVEKQKGIGS